MGQQEGQPSETVVLRDDLFTVQFLPELVVDYFEVAVQHTHAAGDAVF